MAEEYYGYIVSPPQTHIIVSFVVNFNQCQQPDLEEG